jgi:serine/threonine protein phosphatase PrpC
VKITHPSHLSLPAQDVAAIRRRLSVAGGETSLDGGIERLSVAEEEGAVSGTDGRCAVTEYSGLSKKGHAPYNPRKKNQDSLIMADHEATNSLVLCVLDGHGEAGDGVSQWFKKELAKEMFNHPSWVSDPKKATKDAILKVEQQILRNSRVDTEFSGTTLSMAIIRGNTIIGVNIGDSRVTIGKLGPEGKIVAEEFTHDHKPDTPAEKKRIVNAGGRVFAVEYDDGIDGPPRVWLGHMDVPGLAMSRSLGDAVAHTAGVISEPEFFERELDPATDRLILVATDGLWEFMDNDVCVGMAVEASEPRISVDALVREANQRWMREEQVIDDTTVITAHLFGYHGGHA